MNTFPQVVIISAPWCKRCDEMKPEIVQQCFRAGATPRWVNYDDLEEEDPLKAIVKSLPTLGVGLHGKWTYFPAAEFENWKTDLHSCAVMTNADF